MKDEGLGPSRREGFFRLRGNLYVWRSMELNMMLSCVMSMVGEFLHKVIALVQIIIMEANLTSLLLSM